MIYFLLQGRKEDFVSSRHSPRLGNRRDKLTDLRLSRCGMSTSVMASTLDEDYICPKSKIEKKLSQIYHEIMCIPRKALTNIITQNQPPHNQVRKETISKLQLLNSGFSLSLLLATPNLAIAQS